MAIMEREIGYYWVQLDGQDELMPAAWVGGNWYVAGQSEPAQHTYEVREFGKLEQRYAE